MAVRLVVVLGTDEGDVGASKAFDLADDFDTVVERIFPLQQPSSALEQRANMTHAKADGGRVVVPPHHVGWVEEWPD